VPTWELKWTATQQRREEHTRRQVPASGGPRPRTGCVASPSTLHPRYTAPALTLVRLEVKKSAFRQKCWLILSLGGLCSETRGTTQTELLTAK
jgi:hypothetical protein